MIPLAPIVAAIEFALKHWKLTVAIVGLLGTGVALEYARVSGYQSRVKEEAQSLKSWSSSSASPPSPSCKPRTPSAPMTMQTHSPS
jgi:hypothetical protein